MTGWYIIQSRLSFVNLLFLCGCQVAHTCHILSRREQSRALLHAGLLVVAVSTAAAAGQLHGRDDKAVEFIHVDDRHCRLGGGLTTQHLDLGGGQAWQASVRLFI